MISLPKTTPHHMVRLETDSLPLQFTIIKKSLNWLYKFLNMEDHRYPKVCFNLLIKLHTTQLNNNCKFNWLSQLNSLLYHNKQTPVLLRELLSIGGPDIFTYLNLLTLIEGQDTFTLLFYT